MRPSDSGALARSRRPSLSDPVFWDLWLSAGVTLLTAGVATFTALTGIGAFPSPIPNIIGPKHPVRIVLTVGFVLFVPGYAFVSALFPDAEPLDGIERTAIGFGASVALTGLLTIALNFSPLGIRLLPLAVTLAGFTLVCLLVAGLRRARLLVNPSTETARPYIVPFDRLRPLLADIAGSITGRTADSRLDHVLTIALVISIIVAAGTGVWVLSSPRPGAEFTEFYLLTEDEDGDLVAGDFPTNLTTSEPANVVVGIENHEFEPTTYTVVIRLRDPATGQVATIRTIRDIRTAHNATWREPVSVTPPFAGEDLRLEFHLYIGTETSGTPYRETYLLVDVQAADASQAQLDAESRDKPRLLKPSTPRGVAGWKAGSRHPRT